MATHRATTQCFFGSHLYEVGEEATFLPGVAVPEHFEKIGAAKKGAEDEEADETNAAKGAAKKGA